MEIIIVPRRSGTLDRSIKLLQVTNPKRIKKTAITVPARMVDYIKDKKDLVIITHEDFIKGNYNKKELHDIYVFNLKELLQTMSHGEDHGPEITKVFITTTITAV